MDIKNHIEWGKKSQYYIQDQTMASIEFVLNIQNNILFMVPHMQ